MRKYKQELADKKDFIRQLQELEKEQKTITLLFGAKDIEHNNAVVLLQVLRHGNS